MAETRCPYAETAGITHWAATDGGRRTARVGVLTSWVQPQDASHARARRVQLCALNINYPHNIDADIARTYAAINATRDGAGYRDGVSRRLVRDRSGATQCLRARTAGVGVQRHGDERTGRIGRDER